MDIDKKEGKDIEQVIKRLFKKEELESLAKQSKFVQRKTSQLNGYNFLMLNLFEASTQKEKSLNDCCDWLYEEFDVDMRKQSLDERYNTDAVRFMRSCLERLLNLSNPFLDGSGLHKKWACISLTDSTSYKIPSHFSAFYKGYPNGGEGILKLQLNYDLLSGHLFDLSVHGGKDSDCRYQKESGEKFKSNGLYIRDLGYFDTAHFYDLDKQGAYFISRSKSNQNYYAKDEKGEYEKINIEAYLPNTDKQVELKDVYVGTAKKRVKVRLIMERVPENVLQKRMAKLKRASSKQSKRQISAERRKMSQYNIFITNTTEEDLPMDQIRMVYTLRWQIELIFKIWKSVFDIDKVKNMSIFRFECHLYAQLINIVLTMFITNKIGLELWKKYQFEISPWIVAKLVKKNIKTYTWQFEE